MTVYYENSGITLHQGNALDVLRMLPSGSVRTCVTSPPYWGLRDYGETGQLGLEPTPEEYVGKMVTIFAEVRRVLADDGTLWLNLGDCYNGGGTHHGSKNQGLSKSYRKMVEDRMTNAPGLKSKDLVGIPWRVAFALQADGWYLRSDIIWSKPNPMPESVTDRPTKAHEYIFLLSKSAKYYYDGDRIKEAAIEGTDLGLLRGKNAGQFSADKIAWHAQSIKDRQDAGVNSKTANPSGKRNKRSVWTVPTSPFPDAHFAVFPPDLIKPCVLAGSAAGDVVLDPFVGSGTTAYVAKELNRGAIGIDLSKKYLAMAAKRLRQEVLPLMVSHAL